MSEMIQLKTGLEEESPSLTTELPDIINGVATPKRPRGRPPGSKTKNKTPDLTGFSALPPQASSGFSPPKQKRVKFNIAKALGPEMVSQMARAPVFLADMGGTLVSKGKLAGINGVLPGQWEAIDAAFVTVLDENGLEIEASPVQVWLGTCFVAYVSGMIAQLAESSFKLKRDAGTLPRSPDGVDLGAHAANGQIEGIGERPSESISNGVAESLEYRSRETTPA